MKATDEDGGDEDDVKFAREEGRPAWPNEEPDYGDAEKRTTERKEKREWRN